MTGNEIDVTGAYATEIYVREYIAPGRFLSPSERRLEAFVDLDKALDGRRTKLRTNVPWRQKNGNVWTTQSTDYAEQRYPHYIVSRVTLT